MLEDGRTVLLVGSEPSRPRRTWLTDLSGTKARPVTPEGTVELPTPDGRYLVARSGSQVFLRPPAGGEPREVRGVLAGEEIAGWGPDERHAFVYRPTEIPARAFRVDATTGSRELVREVAPADPVGISQLGILMTPDGKACAYSAFQWLSQLHVISGLR